MNWKKVLEVGLKITASLFAGGMVFAGVAKGIEKNKAKQQQAQNPPQQPQQQPQQQPVNNMYQPVYNAYGQPMQPQQQEDSMAVSGLKSMTNTCGKLYTLSQTVTCLVDSIGKLFDDNSPCCPNQMGGYPNMNNNGYYGCGSGNGQWNRISPFIVQA